MRSWKEHNDPDKAHLHLTRYEAKLVHSLMKHLSTVGAKGKELAAVNRILNAVSEEQDRVERRDLARKAAMQTLEQLSEPLRDTELRGTKKP